MHGLPVAKIPCLDLPESRRDANLGTLVGECVEPEDKRLSLLNCEHASLYPMGYGGQQLHASCWLTIHDLAYSLPSMKALIGCAL